MAELNNWELTIRLGSVTFSPHWEGKDERGNKTGHFRSVIGELSIQCNDLPSDLQKQLTDIIAAAVKKSKRDKHMRRPLEKAQ